MQDIYDFFYDINRGLIQWGLLRLDDMLRPAIMSGLLSDMLTASLSKHSRALTVNLYHNGHPDLVVNGVYAGNRIKAGEQGIEIRTTRKSGGAVDTHGARNQWMCVFVYTVDCATEPARKRGPMTFTEIYLGSVVDDFRKNSKGRTRHSYCYPSQDRHRKTTEELDLQVRRMKIAIFKSYQSWQSLSRHFKVVDIFLNPNTGISYRFSRSKRRSCSTKWVQHEPLPERKNTSHQCS
jgi:hypothetical protein